MELHGVPAVYSARRGNTIASSALRAARGFASAADAGGNTRA